MNASVILVAAVDEGCSAAVLGGDDVELRLTGYPPERDEIQLKGLQPARLMLAGEHAVIGGRLPAGAVQVTVHGSAGEPISATVDHDAWVAITPDPVAGVPGPPVTFRDADGGLVAPDLPPAWPREPVTDTNMACPGCGAIAWDQVIPRDGSRGFRHGESTPWEPCPVIVCRACGHEEVMGWVVQVTNTGDAQSPDAKARLRSALEMWRLSNRDRLEAVTFPVYALCGSDPGRLAGLSREHDTLRCVTVAHGHDDRRHAPHLEVATELDPQDHAVTQPVAQPAALARGALAELLSDGVPDWRGGSDAAFVLALRAEERAARLVAAQAVRSEIGVALDGVETAFTCVQHGERWAAVGWAPVEWAPDAAASEQHTRLRITLTATGVDAAAVKLNTVAEPAQNLV